MRPVVFLDVDGVLVVSRAVRAPRPMGMRSNGMAYRRPARIVSTTRTFAPVAVDAVNRLCGAADAMVVLSSFWRLKPDSRELIGAAGLDVEWHDRWRTDEGGGRGAEITRWLEAEGNPPHVILDDRTVELAAHGDRVVPVNFRRGLLPCHADHALTVLAAQGVPLALPRGDAPAEGVRQGGADPST
ncbi:HAD domain-containing protein [Sphingomonas bacterium]|uniref:HAD domain-containing protein n=1 Tax=Sphingomonas bacterium TaxID=1895847 RepID=UPI001576B906|nr:HAD domain-containing protein [Sphingomonas bacterium]